jgi:hypothetical protein
MTKPYARKKQAWWRVQVERAAEALQKKGFNIREPLRT